MHTRNEKFECSAVFFHKNVPLSTCLFAYYALSYCANIPKQNTNTRMKSISYFIGSNFISGDPL